MNPSGATDAHAGDTGTTSTDAPTGGLDPTPGEYRGICDGSGAIAIDATHFLAFSDNDQFVRRYQRAAANPTQVGTDISGALGLTTADEADLEDAARVGDHVFVIASHGRKKTGTLDPARYRLFAGTVDAAGAFTVTASTTQLLQQMLDASHWDAPNTAVIAALDAASQLAVPKDPNLAPKVNGTNIEGMAFAPTATAPERLVIGFRNPRPNNQAIVVSLVNPSAAVTGAPARFGEAIELDLGGLGIRGMAWSEPLGAVLLIAGPVDGADAPFKLYRWAGTAGAAPELVTDLTTPAFLHPEAIVTYPGYRDVQILFDNDDLPVNGGACNAQPADQRAFHDMIVAIP